MRITLSADAPRVFADVDPSPALSIGGAEDAGPARFYRIQNVRVDGRGRVWVADGGSGELRIFLPDGTPWKTRGGVGEGPGEFTSIRLLGAFAGDSVLVADDANGRVTVFDLEGEIARSVSEPAKTGPGPGFSPPSRTAPRWARSRASSARTRSGPTSSSSTR